MSNAEFTASRTYPVTVEQAFDAVLPADLTAVFDRWFGPIAPIARISDQQGVWGAVGQTRTIHPRSGGSMHETLTQVERPDRFAYRIDDLRGPLKALIAVADGSWTFTPAGTGTRVSWRWVVQPTNPVSARAMPALGVLWRGYAAKGLDRLEALLVG